MRLLTFDLMVCSLSSSQTVNYADKRNTQKAWIEFDIASISDVLCKWSSYAIFSFKTHSSRGERLLIRDNAIAKKFKEGTTTYSLALSFSSIVNADMERECASEEHGNVHHRSKAKVNFFTIYFGGGLQLVPFHFLSL